MDAVLQAALFGAAGDLQVIAAEVGTEGTYEPDMRASLRRALQVAIGLHPIDGTIGAGVKPETPVKLADFPRVGSFDLAVVPRDLGPHLAVLELKWCRSPNDIWMCLFDIAKTALAVSSNVADAGYVVAGAPLIEWRRKPQVSELFDGGEFIPGRVRDEYEKPWAFLLKGAKLARPRRLPSKITTRRVVAVPIHTAAGDWELRVARVFPQTAEFTEFDGSGWPAASTQDPHAGLGNSPPPAERESANETEIASLRTRRFRVVATVPRSGVWLVEDRDQPDQVRAIDQMMGRIFPPISYIDLRQSEWWDLFGFSEDVGQAPTSEGLLASVTEIAEVPAEYAADPRKNLPSFEGRDFGGGDAGFHRSMGVE